MTRLAPRPLRGSPTETRRRIVHAAAEVFNQGGYDGTDSNRLARAAGYSPGTFYKHFADKRQLFLAVYDEWVAREWRDVQEVLAVPGSRDERAARIVAVFLQHHRRWRGVRASLRALVAHDPAVRDFYRAQRRRQLELLAELDAASGRRATREADALLLFSIERTADAFADDEPHALGLDGDLLQALLVDLVRARL